MGATISAAIHPTFRKALYVGNKDGLPVPVRLVRQPSHARADAASARRLGTFSPLKFYYDASSVIAATVSGDHDDAVRAVG